MALTQIKTRFVSTSTTVALAPLLSSSSSGWPEPAVTGAARREGE